MHFRSGANFHTINRNFHAETEQNTMTTDSTKLQLDPSCHSDSRHDNLGARTSSSVELLLQHTSICPKYSTKSRANPYSDKSFSSNSTTPHGCKKPSTLNGLRMHERSTTRNNIVWTNTSNLNSVAEYRLLPVPPHIFGQFLAIVTNHTQHKFN